MRSCGHAWINVEAGYIDEGRGPVLQEIPYGALPRLALSWVTSYAKRKKSREVPIGNSAADFLRLLGLDRQGGRYATLRKQMHALAACRLVIGYQGATFSGQPIELFHAWQRRGADHQLNLWPGRLVLTEGFFNALCRHSVPVDLRAVHALKQSALAMDIYVWLAHRLHRVEGNFQLVPWITLKGQFGQEYGGAGGNSNFRRMFLHALKRVAEVYPTARLAATPDGLALRRSPPPIGYRLAAS